jgi:hypothetical protein
MVKPRDRKLTLPSFVPTFLVLAVLIMMNLLSLVGCSNGVTTQNTTTTLQTTPQPPNPNHLQSGYSAPNWWKPCIPSKVISVFIDGANRQVCTAWDQSQPAAQCDSMNYQTFTGTAAKPLLSWRGFDVCGPRPDWTPRTPDHYTEFSSGGSVEQEFECTELVKRYLLLAFGLPSLGGTNGDQIVDNYTNTTKVPGTPFHKVINDAANNGKIHMFPVEGDVLSYSTVHTSIVKSVTDMNSRGEGSATIHVIEQNRSSEGEEKLTMTNWIIDNSVSSWMTTRPISSQLPTSIPTLTPTQTLPSRFSGTLDENQNATTYQVALERTQTHTDGSFDGKWYATINGSDEDVIVNGVIVSFNESNRFSQISQDKIQQLQQQFGSNGTLLWFTSTSYDVGQDIWLGCEYYGLLQPNGSVQGVWYPPGSNAEGGTFQLA